MEIDHTNVAIALYRLLEQAIEADDDYGPLTLGGDMIKSVESLAHNSEQSILIVTTLGTQYRYKITVDKII